MNTLISFIEYMNASKKFQKEKKYFTGEDAFLNAKKWGQANLENFHIDMIHFATSSLKF